MASLRMTSSSLREHQVKREVVVLYVGRTGDQQVKGRHRQPDVHPKVNFI
jgi:hypothetical protein